MQDFSDKLSNYLKNNKLAKDYSSDLIISGKNPWELRMILSWKEIGKLEISSFELEDIWALRDWWINTLSYDNRRFHPLFPCDNRTERYIVNHFKNTKNRKYITFNAWLLKEDLGFNNEIIGHFYLMNYDSDKPNFGLGISDKFQGKKLGVFFIIMIIYIAKILGKKSLWLTTDLDNNKGYSLYKKIGFEDSGNTEVYIPADNYMRVEREMKLDLNKY